MQRRILVVDDNRDIADSMAEVLRLLGHECETATNGLRALELSEEWGPELVVLDVSMPGLTGYEVARKLRATEWGAGTLLVAMTGWSGDEDRAKALAAGFDAIETKPLDLARLRSLIDQLGSRAGTA
ncbi:MAG: response regulator [Gemmatimonadota bacterium]